MHNRLNLLQPYPFQKLSDLLQHVRTPNDLVHIALSIGEPRHPPPQFVLDELQNNLDCIATYPQTKGTEALRESIAAWIQKRYQCSISSERQVLPVNGTREALFSIAQCMIDSSTSPIVIMPNPFYQIYEGAAILAGAQPYLVNTSADNGYLPSLDDIPETVWQKCQLFYACSPGNPTGAVFSKALWFQLIEYADKYDFVIAADECYSEIYADENSPPVGLLQVCHESGRHDFSRCVVFHSLSKRSNLPGLRSGFVAGDATIINQFLQYRTYHGCAMSVPTQCASIAAWNDEDHVLENRQMYREKYDAVLSILSPWMSVKQPAGSFYLWPDIPGGDEESFCQGLFEKQHVTVLPGRYLSRATNTGNPGIGKVRMALVAETRQCIEAAHRIAKYCEQLSV